MPISLFYSDSTKALYGDAGCFDPWKLCWTPQESGMPADAVAVAPGDAVALLARAGSMRRVPVAVIGPRDAKPEEQATAEALGNGIGTLGLQLLCGGKGGVMEAVCKGCLEAGGLPIGLVPDEEWSAANPYVAIPLATGIGPARNAIIARAAEVLIAVGGGYGTLSEMAYGLHFDRLVLTLGDAPSVPGAIACASVEEALDRACQRLLRLDR
ncbi:MAG: LOG family protein [Alphaproteobacteria bacterium]|nr:LOG family protein [Alphaproteobacteria bacterium]MBU0796006.1 LOG family protein [Alphaproteobacteria bacterium]MBU0886858.1 LOG family protein [Alphaproteobacteria bacterium]MBU1812399.1 LOG family protein [Alphaproteobacteria bacterium]MBU2090318.1 LOG family protein [Alphaproteobacteria bacterium]